MRLLRRFKLQDFCLEVVIQNLEKFIGNEHIPQKHIDYLLRVYAKEVFKKLRSFTDISEDQMLWFLNPHSRKITLSKLSEKIVSRLQIIGQTVTSLDLHGALISESMINSIICCIPNVTHLYLSSSLCSNKTLLCIQRMCSAVIKLDIQNCRHVTNRGMVNLCGPNKSLKYLNLIGTMVDVDGIPTVLKGMPLLQCVKYCEMPTIIYDMHALDFERDTYSGIKYNLTELIYEFEGVHDPVKVLLLWTILCPNVKKLHIKFNATKEMLEMCSNFRYLEDLQIDCPGDSWMDILYSSQDGFDEETMYAYDTLVPFINCSSYLTTLTLCSVMISLNTLVQCYKNVKNLTLWGVTFEDLAEEVRLEENNVDFLCMRDISLSVKSNFKAVCGLLSVSKNVSNLRIHYFRDLPEEIFDVILTVMKNLELVDFSFTPIKTSTVLKFLEIPTMKAIYLDICFNLEPFDTSELKKFVLANRICNFNWHLDYSDSDSDDEY